MEYYLLHRWNISQIFLATSLKYSLKGMKRNVAFYDFSKKLYSDSCISPKI
jgi:hypothetical protein